MCRYCVSICVVCVEMVLWLLLIVFFQAEDGIRDRVRSRGLGDVYKRQVVVTAVPQQVSFERDEPAAMAQQVADGHVRRDPRCLLYTSDAADERSSVDLGGRRILKKKNKSEEGGVGSIDSKRKRLNTSTRKQ